MRWQPTQCPVCCRMLVHRQGAAILRCPACLSLLNVYGHPSTPGQTECPSCALLLHHPLGPPYVQCPACATAVATPIRYYQCRRCRLFLSYSTTLQVVVCPVCFEAEPPLSSPSHIQRFPPLNTHALPRPPPQLPRRRFPWLHQIHIPPHMLSSPLQLHQHPILPPPLLSIPPQPSIPTPTAPSTNDNHHRHSQTPPPQTGESLAEAEVQPNS